MSFFKGNTSGTEYSAALESSADILSYTIANKSGGGITASVGLFYGSTIVYVLYNEALSAGQTYVYPGEPINIPTGYQIQVTVSGDADYYFTVRKPKPTS